MIHRSGPSLLAVVVLICFVAAGCGDKGSEDADILGNWQGGLTENTGERFGIVLEISSLETGTEAATVTYPGLGSDKGCSGTWRYQGTQDNRYRFAETITAGRSSKCFGTGEVTLTTKPSPSKLGYKWRSGPHSSSGTIERPPG